LANSLFGVKYNLQPEHPDQLPMHLARRAMTAAVPAVPAMLPTEGGRKFSDLSVVTSYLFQRTLKLMCLIFLKFFS
jgi:hypothetical protein